MLRAPEATEAQRAEAGEQKTGSVAAGSVPVGLTTPNLVWCAGGVVRAGASEWVGGGGGGNAMEDEGGSGAGGGGSRVESGWREWAGAAMKRGAARNAAGEDDELSEDRRGRDESGSEGVDGRGC